MTPTDLCLQLYEQKAVSNRFRLELDGTPCKIEDFHKSYYAGSIVRINKYLYMDGQQLTEDGPKWEELWLTTPRQG